MMYETVIGLEVHVELATRTKIFCGCPTQFGAAPNTQVCPICAGLPGALPNLNRQALDLGMRAGLATGCRISTVTRFDRKHYFYPDLPKAYQISQLYAPLCTDGLIRIACPGEAEKEIRIREIHLEEDAGKLIHDPWTDATWIDLNRCGVPLIEIVSQPDLSSAEEAVAYLSALAAILQYTGVSDCKMEEGSMRADINLSVRPVGSTTLGTRTEMKNMNSLKAISRAIVSETARQIDRLESGKPVLQETRRWDDNKGKSLPMRSKEDAPDYQYFPDPDLPTIVVAPSVIETLRKQLPELPAARLTRFIETLGLAPADAALLTASPHLSGWFEAVGRLSGSYQEAANWILSDVFKWFNATGRTPESLDTPPERLARTIELVRQGTITRESARRLLPRILGDGADPDRLVEAEGLKVIGDEDQIEDAVRAVLAEQSKAVADYLAGNEKVLAFLTGQTMRRLGGKAPVVLVQKCLTGLLDKTRRESGL